MTHRRHDAGSGRSYCFGPLTCLTCPRMTGDADFGKERCLQRCHQPDKGVAEAARRATRASRRHCACGKAGGRVPPGMFVNCQLARRKKGTAQPREGGLPGRPAGMPRGSPIPTKNRPYQSRMVSVKYREGPVLAGLPAGPIEHALRQAGSESGAVCKTGRPRSRCGKDASEPPRSGDTPQQRDRAATARQNAAPSRLVDGPSGRAMFADCQRRGCTLIDSLASIHTCCWVRTASCAKASQ